MTKLQNSKKVYFSIREVAKQFGVTHSLLRYWEKEFSIINPLKSAKGTRLYSKEVIEKIALVHHLLKEKRMTIEGAKQELSKKRDIYEKKIDAINRLESIKKELLGLINEI